MICLALGLGILGFWAARKARRCRGYYWHHHHPYGWANGGWYGGWHGRYRRHGLHMALAHIDATPAQERAIVAEVDRLSERVHAAKATVMEGRADLGAAVRGPVLDDAALGAVLGRADSASAEVRSAMIDALRNIHGVLDDKQRHQLADFIDGHYWWGMGRRGPGASGGGPYRV
jgi:Spy/CpxP family protein refolding chaperone